MTQPQSENQAAKELQDGGIGHIVTVESPGARRPVRFHLHSKVAQACGARTIIRRDRDGHDIFHNLDAASMYDAKLHGLACGLGIQSAQEILWLFEIMAVDAENDVAVSKAGAIRRRAGQGIMYE